jgi:hypothetical protein
MPSLLAWPGLLMPAYAGLAWLGFMLVLCYLVDRTCTGMPGWPTGSPCVFTCQRLRH